MCTTNPTEKKYHTVRIKKSPKGNFSLSVGCKTLVVHSWQATKTILDEYWENPEKAEKQYCEI